MRIIAAAAATTSGGPPQLSDPGYTAYGPTTHFQFVDTGAAPSDLANSLLSFLLNSRQNLLVGNR